MQKTADEVYQLIQELSEVEHIKLMELIAGPPPTLHPAWGPELRRRAAELDSGEVKGISYDELKMHMKTKLEQIRANHVSS